MKIKIVGAAGGEVTGSSYLIETANAKVMVDAGMFQGGRNTEEKNRLPEGTDPKILDALLLTHAHLDHTGRIPLLLKNGFKNTIYATDATIDLAEIVLKDSAKIQEQDAARKNRYHPERHVEPLYTPNDTLSFRSQCQTVELHQHIPVADGITARFFEAGHMLGSTSIELTVHEKGKTHVVVFSGDLGPIDQPILRPFEQLPHADLVFMESTYGNRDHRPYNETIKEFEEIILKAVESKGKILIPAFAIGRTQQILYHLAILFVQKKVRHFPVFVDSPMAIRAGKVFAEHPDLFDEEATDWKRQGLLPLDRNWFQFCVSMEESKQLNSIEGPCVILAGAGMCNAGRIQHHLKFNLPHQETQVLIVGYQGSGSLGRQLVDGATQVKIHGETIPVRAQIHTLNGFSAHAGQSDLLKWFSSLGQMKPKVVLTHGENLQRETLADQIEKKYGLKPLLPELNETVEI
ncbi:MBL fold metallo-hydrolase RNA specificity domain-containing protein [Estrella lausannensis]|uniref:Beta-lactamase domain-containing protein n=1 Tax=Estrella lausannensis TaxID=483423 RepID=A0A0H5DPM1_9BACT|nr:MBL fold metallo-hydrolase [Estrella lausannensis]CRX37953.1 beta-lactamase domain-containing protein [Estrella lausannensis]